MSKYAKSKNFIYIHVKEDETGTVDKRATILLDLLDGDYFIATAVPDMIVGGVHYVLQKMQSTAPNSSTN